MPGGGGARKPEDRPVRDGRGAAQLARAGARAKAGVNGAGGSRRRRPRLLGSGGARGGLGGRLGIWGTGEQKADGVAHDRAEGTYTLD